MYSQLSTLPPDSHFQSVYDSKLEDWWPQLLSCTGAEGMDAVALLRKDLRAQASSAHPAEHCNSARGIPLPRLQNVESKYNFSIKDAVSSSYNHSLNLTDYIIAWDLAIEGKATPFDPDMEFITISDCFGCTGQVCVEYEDPRRPGHVHKVLQWNAYFITNMRTHNNEEAGQQESRVGHGTIKVVALSALIKATFDPQCKGLVKVYSDSSRSDDEDDALDSSSDSEPAPPPAPKRRRKSGAAAGKRSCSSGAGAGAAKSGSKHVKAASPSNKAKRAKKAKGSKGRKHRHSDDSIDFDSDYMG